MWRIFTGSRRWGGLLLIGFLLMGFQIEHNSIFSTRAAASAAPEKLGSGPELGSNVTSLQEDEEDELNQPTNLQAVAVSAARIDLTWEDNSQRENAYLIERSPNGSDWARLAAIGQNSETYSDMQVACDRHYHYRVRAYRAGGDDDDPIFSLYSDPAEVDTPACAAPAAPTRLTATAVSAEQINLTWQDNAADENSYRVERSTNGSNWSEIAQLPANTTGYFSRGLTCATRYYYRVRAFRQSDGQFSAYSSAANAVTAECAAPCPTITGWKGEYWDNMNWSGAPELCRDDTNVAFEWDIRSPAPGIPEDGFSVRWTRTLSFLEGEYIFIIFHDDGLKFYIDGDKVFEDLCGNCRRTAAITRRLSAGDHTLRVEMFDQQGWASITLYWTAPDLNLGLYLPLVLR